MPQGKSDNLKASARADGDGTKARAEGLDSGHKHSPTVNPVAQPELSLRDMSRIMEVASTLRKERLTAQKQLNLDETKALLRARLLQTTKVTGENLTPAEVDRAIEQYYENLHTYQEPSQGFQVLLAHLYVRRAKLLKWLFALVAIGVFIVTWWVGRGALEKKQYENIQTACEQHIRTIVALADEPQLASSLQAELDQAADESNPGDLAQLQALETRLAQQEALYQAEYQVVILSQPDTPSGTERKYTDTQGTRTSGYYVFVEAHNKDGSLRKMHIKNRETGDREWVQRWGEQVPESVFNRLVEDKKSDGILDETLFATKQRGQTEETMILKDDEGQPIGRQGQITSW